MKRRPFIALSLVLDAVFVNVGIVSAFLIRFGGELPAFNFDAYVATAPIITLLYLGAGYVYGLYEPERTENTWAIARSVVSAVTLGAALTAALLFFGGLRFISFSRVAIILSWFINAVLLVLWRVLFMRAFSIAWPQQHVLLVGTGPVAAEIAEELRRRERWGYRVVGTLAASDEAGVEPVRQAGLPVLGTVSDAAKVVAEHDVQRVIVVSPVAIRELIEDFVLAEEADVRIDVVPELYEVFIGKVDAIVADIPLMEITRSSARPWYPTFKSIADVLFGFALLVAMSPILLLSALAILLSMGRPVLYVQERLGKDMHPFKVYKLRTMVRDAERETGPVLASDDDARITRLGRVLRRYRLDELPQLLNIVGGDMSFVGPRPERPYFVERHAREIPGYTERYKVKPGVTGLAQVSGGYATTAERKLKYDLIYMYHQNLTMDLEILIETLRVVLTGRGAR